MTATEDLSPDTSLSRLSLSIILGVSAAAVGLLIWLVYGDRPVGPLPAWVALLPVLNATLNSLSALCLWIGYRFIKAGKRRQHVRMMLSAVLFSSLFLCSYVTYHSLHGDTRFTGEGLVRPLYFAVLISHIVTSILALPLILTTLYFALMRRFASHRAIARFTFPAWLYVSVTGVLVFAFLELWG